MSVFQWQHLLRGGAARPETLNPKPQTRGWAKGEVSDDDVIREYGVDFLVSLRNEFEMQGGTTPSGVQEDGACEGGVDMDNLAVVPPPAESHVEGAEATGLRRQCRQERDGAL